MKPLRNKTIVLLAVLLLTISIGASTIQIPTTSAHDPAWEIPTYAYIAVSPDPVGVGQQVAVVVWVDKMPYGASVYYPDIRFHDYKVVITAPNGDTETINWDVITDTTSSAYTSFTPDQIGIYTFNFTFPGQTYTWTTKVPASFFGAPEANPYTNDTYLASSATTTLTVQEEPIVGTSSNPLPTEYWTRPIYGENSNWYTIASNWLGSPQITANYQSGGSAPDSAHVMWTKELQFGGIVGGTNTGIDGNAYYAGMSYEGKFANPLIIQGRLYYALPESNNAAGGGYVCVDLQTGETLWQQNYAVNPTFASLEDFESMNQHGVISSGYLWAVSGTTRMIYDPLDGSWLFNITNVPSGTMAYGPNGEILIYVLNSNAGTLAMWNFTELFPLSGVTFSNNQYRPIGKVIDGSTAYSWNITVPSSVNIAGATIRGAITDDLILCSSTLMNSQSSFDTPDPYTFWALSLDPDSRGTLQWKQSYSAPANNATRQFAFLDPTNRMFIMFDKETVSFYGYSLDNGKLQWGPNSMDRAFDYYSATVNSYDAGAHSVAYGNLYACGYGGLLYCWDTETGDLLWTYGNGGEGNSTNSGITTPYGYRPIFIGAIADDKVYLFSSEHSPNTPLYVDTLIRCVNATSGEELWTISGWGTSGTFYSANGALADGYYTYLNAYDMQIYCVGKGPSQVTVTAPDAAVELGTSVVIKGTVTDIAAGTEQYEQAKRFPNGVACVSDESQSAWMEYIYMQQQRPTNLTGVNIELYALDSNNNYRTIGTTTTDTNGFYSLQYTPDITGKYTVYAIFSGTNSYYGSQATTAFAVDETAATASPQPTQTPTAADLYFLPAIAGVIIAILAVGLLTILVLKKKP
jgi:outer membrane protein assembly factor BamB